MRQVNHAFSFNKKFFIKFLVILLIIFSIDTCYLIFGYNTSFGYYVPDSNTTKVSVQIGDVYTFYTSFTSALYSVPDNTPATIFLHTDITMSGPIIIGSKKKITINGKNTSTITRFCDNNGDWYTDNLFEINYGGELTLLNVTIDSNNDWSFDKKAYDDYLKNNKNIDISKIIVPEVGGAIANDYLIKNSGTLTIKNSKIKNFFSENKGLFNSLGTSSTTLIKTEISHCATLSGGLVAYIQNNDTKFYIKDNTIITNNFAGDDGGLFKVDSGSELIIDSALINDNYAIDSNGYVVMVMGSNSTFTMNGGEIVNNSSLSRDGKSGNGAIYLSLNGKIVMNGGKIHNNQGSETGGVASDDSKTSADLNDGIIENNKSTLGDNYKSDISINSDLNIGEDFTVNGNISLNGTLNNNGNINGNVIVDNNGNNTIKGNGNVTGEIVNKKENQVIVSFNYNGGVDKDNKYKSIISVNVNDKILFPTLEKKGYSLEAWYLDKDLSKKFNSDRTSENLELFAKWVLKKYKVIWHISDNEKKEIEYYAGEKIKNIETPYKEGYEFVKWDTLIENYIMPETDIVIRAIWQPKIYNIKFETNGANKINDILCEYGNTILMPKNPTLKDKKFTGWYIDRQLNILYDFNKPVKESFTLYAGWKDEPIESIDKIDMIEGEIKEDLFYNREYEYKKGSHENLIIDIPDELMVLNQIKINNNVIGKQNYIIKENDVELKKEYLETKNNGNYSVELVFENGIIQANIKIIEGNKGVTKFKKNISIIIAISLLLLSFLGIYLLNKKR